MPRGDRTGPVGQGPMTGRRAGYCAGFAAPGFANGGGWGQGLGQGWRRGPGWGRGYGRGWLGYTVPAYSPPAPGNWPLGGPVMDSDSQLRALRSQAEQMRSMLSQIEEQIRGLQEEDDT